MMEERYQGRWGCSMVADSPDLVHARKSSALQTDFRLVSFHISLYNTAVYYCMVAFVLANDFTYHAIL